MKKTELKSLIRNTILEAVNEISNYDKMTPQQQRQYDILRDTGWEYDYMEDGVVYMNRWDRRSDSSSRLATMVIKPDGEHYRQKGNTNENYEDGIKDAKDRMAYKALRKQEQDYISKSKQAKDPIKKQHFIDMSKQVLDKALDILRKHKVVDESVTNEMYSDTSYKTQKGYDAAKKKIESLKAELKKIQDLKNGEDYVNTNDPQARNFHNRRLKEIPKEISAIRQKILGLKSVKETNESIKQVDMTGKKCEKCKKGSYGERSQHDDMDGKVTCDKCGNRVDRYKTSVNESTPPGFPKKIADKILKRYKDAPQKAYATMWSLHNKHKGKLEEMWAAWESKNQPISEEASMAAADLDAIEHYIGHLKQLIHDDSDLEDWIKAKLTMAKSNLSSVFANLNHAAKSSGQPGVECNECMEEVKQQSLNEVVGAKPVVGQNKYNYVVTYTLQGTNQSIKSLAPIYASSEVDAKKIAIAPFNPNMVKITSVKVTNLGPVIQADVDAYNKSIEATADSIQKFGTTN